MNNENKQAILVNKIAILIDLQDQYMDELLPELRQNLKMITSNASNHTKRVIKQFDSILSEKHAINFGEDADLIRTEIDKIFER